VEACPRVANQRYFGRADLAAESLRFEDANKRGFAGKSRMAGDPVICEGSAFLTMMKNTTYFLLPSVIALLIACQHFESGPEVDTGAVDFVRDVKPLLMDQCLPCHHSDVAFGGFNLETEAKALTPGRHGRFIDPGNPEGSLLWQLVTSKHPDQFGEDLMPANGPRLSREDKRMLYRWIEQGATWPDAEPGHLHPLQDPNEA
jgi:hypothetical protein